MALINIASDKQLFADNYLIESLKDARQVMNPARKLENNPILWPEKPWEGDYLGVSDVWFDHADQVFKMFYRPATHRAYLTPDGTLAAEAPTDDDPITACLALSDDGINWERPELGLVEYKGSKKNNLLPEDAFMPYFFQDLHEEDPRKRYKGLIRTGSTTTTMTFDLYYSPDSLNWTPCEHNPVIDTAPRIGRWGPTKFMGWDPIRQVYAAHMENCHHRRCPHDKRLIGRAESPDMVHWSDPETILMPDEQDPPDTEFYVMPVIVYAGLYVGLPWIFRTNDSTHYPELVFSRNGIHYERNYREPFIQRGAHSGEYDASCVYNLEPLVHNDRIYTYYTGSNWRSYRTLLELGDRGVGAIGVAETPLDGFVAVEGKKTGIQRDGHAVLRFRRPPVAPQPASAPRRRRAAQRVRGAGRALDAQPPAPARLRLRRRRSNHDHRSSPPGLVAGAHRSRRTGRRPDQTAFLFQKRQAVRLPVRRPRRLD